MSWYTSTRNCINSPKIKKSWSDSIAKGPQDVSRAVLDLIRKHRKTRKRTCVLAFDGFLGAQWQDTIDRVRQLLDEQGLKAEVINMSSLYRSRSWIDRFLEPYVSTGDASFGIVNTKGRRRHLMSDAKLTRFKRKIAGLKRKKLSPKSPAVVICCGTGAAIADLRPLYDFVFYFDICRQTLLERVWSNQVVPFGSSEPGPLFWKTLYYAYYPMLIKHSKYLLQRADWYVDNNDPGEPKLLPGKVYRGIISTLVTYPFKPKRMFMPGPWGGLKFRKYFDLPELSNCAWNIECSGPDQSVLIDVGIGSHLEVPFLNLYLQYPVEVVGPYIHAKYPDLFPFQVGIDDGYFDRNVPHERRAMPIHLHPDTNYVKKNFKEPLGRYEVYYIVEAYEGACTMQGFHEDADLDEFQEKLLEAEPHTDRIRPCSLGNNHKFDKEIARLVKNDIKFDWSQYVKVWPSKAGDLYLIPAGTAHGTGGNQMVLEMDTCPSISATEYSFFIYDYFRHTWDENTKRMTGKLMKLQLEHGLKQCRWNRREGLVKKRLRPKTRVIRSGRGWSEERFDSYAPMPYHIERLHFEKKIATTTHGRFVQFVCLTKGDRALIRYRQYPEKQIELEYMQCAIIPACFEDYECVNLGKSPCTVMRQRWKKG